jgi:hypothetical protein
VSVQSVSLGGVLDVDVAVREQLKLCLSVAASGIDGEEDRPCDAKTHKADSAANTKESDEEVGVETLVL